jgi:hypothetical protein
LDEPIMVISFGGRKRHGEPFSASEISVSEIAALEQIFLR